MRYLILLLIFVTPCRAESQHDLRAKAALALATCESDGSSSSVPNCLCGCVDTGKCNCPDCNHPVKGKATLPACECGCEKTGKCVCKNCDTHSKKPDKARVEEPIFVPLGQEPPKGWVRVSEFIPDPRAVRQQQIPTLMAPRSGGGGCGAGG